LLGLLGIGVPMCSPFLSRDAFMHRCSGGWREGVKTPALLHIFYAALLSTMHGTERERKGKEGEGKGGGG
jgi:hypothetical protein